MIVRLWNVNNGAVIDSQKTHDCVTSLRVSPSGTKLLAGLYNGQCIVFSIDSLK